MGFQSKIVQSKRSLGQNFFVNKNLAKQIASAVLDEKPDIVVEIGPGRGAFSQYLINEDNNTKRILIEKDNILAKELIEKFPFAKILNTDFLCWNFSELRNFKEKKILFFGSLPYNVSKKIVKKIIKSEYFNTNAYFIIQKEVAEKFTIRTNESNLLSTTTNIYADFKRLFDISPESFKPKPKVVSSFVRFTPNDKEHCKNIKIEDFEKFLKICFKQPRKKLSNNLKNYYSFKNEKSKALLEKRAQHLSLEEFLSLFCNIK